MLIFLVASSLTINAYAAQLLLPVQSDCQLVKIAQFGGWGDGSNDDAQQRAEEADDRAKQADEDRRRAQWEAQQAQKRADEANDRAKEADERAQDSSGW